ncbi:MAG: hypothetical protein P8I91_01630 [Phycisphaerales bacterium]|nr:hypothetical protein [Phycisphaerales bacterium]
MPVTCVSTSVLALVLLAASTLPPVGDPYTAKGRIERIDRGVDAITTWIALQTGDPLAVQASPDSQPPPVGSLIRITGTRRDDLVLAGPNGHMRRYPVVHTSGAWTSTNTPAPRQTWLVWVLGGLFLVVCTLMIVLGRSGCQRRNRASTETQIPSFETVLLPADPVDALAELARQADEEEA